MVQKQDICPHCGGRETLAAKQEGHGAIYPRKGIFSFGKTLHHVVCKDCGTVIRSYIEDPQDWAKK